MTKMTPMGTKYHLYFDAEIDRGQPIDAVIEENVDLFLWSENHHDPSRPLHGSFAEPMRDSWRRYSFDSVRALPIYGRLALLAESGRSLSGPRWETDGPVWRPTAEATRVEEDLGRRVVSNARLVEVVPDSLEALSDRASHIYEAGLGYALRRYDRVYQAFSVVLRKAIVNGTTAFSVRAYERPEPGGPEDLVAAASLPHDAFNYSFLQLHRDASWNTHSEPA